MARKLGVVPDYFLVPKWFWASAAAYRLSDPEKLTFLAMCSMCDLDRLVTSSQQSIADEAGISLSSVKRALPALVERGFLVDLGQSAPRQPRHYRISQAKPLPPAAQFPVNVRALHPDAKNSGWRRAAE